MRFLNGLIGLLLVSATAGGSFGQSGFDCYIALNQARMAVTERDNTKAETDGYWALATYLRDSVRNDLGECLSELSAGKFDPSYNGDPAMPEAKKKLDDRRFNLKASLAVLWGLPSPINTTGTADVSLSTYGTWVAANSISSVVASLDFYETVMDNTPSGGTPSGYTWAQIKAALDANKATANTQKTALLGFKSTAKGASDATDAIGVNVLILLNDIKNY